MIRICSEANSIAILYCLIGGRTSSVGRSCIRHSCAPRPTFGEYCDKLAAVDHRHSYGRVRLESGLRLRLPFALVMRSSGTIGLEDPDINNTVEELRSYLEPIRTAVGSQLKFHRCIINVFTPPNIAKSVFGHIENKGYLIGISTVLRYFA